MNINKTNLNFTAGKTKILSDFDGTFMPKEFGHDLVCNPNTNLDTEAFSKYFGEFEDFFESQNKDEKKTELTISTGRNLYEFNYYMKKIKDKNLSTPNPDKLIITNGGDEYICDKKNYFESNRDSMFSPANLNIKKRAQIKQFLVSYNPKNIRSTVRKFLRSLSNKPNVLYPKTHQGMFGYKDDLTLQERVEKKGNITNYVSMRKDGAYQIRLTAPNGSPQIEELKQIPEKLEKLGYRITANIDGKDNETFVNSVENPTQWSQGLSVNIKPLAKGKVQILDKFHHAKLMSDEIIESNSNDLVIVSGDGENDLGMLDLSNYIDAMKDFSDFSKPEFREEIAKLPIVSIFVRNSSYLDEKILEFEKAFNFDGKKRFIIVDKENPTRPQTLLDAIKMAQIEYSKINEEYRRNI